MKIKMSAFLESLELTTNYFDDFCDCFNENEHDEDCRTMLYRKDFDNIDWNEI